MGIPKKRPRSRKWTATLRRQLMKEKQCSLDAGFKDSGTLPSPHEPANVISAKDTDNHPVLGVVVSKQDACITSSNSPTIDGSEYANASLRKRAKFSETAKPDPSRVLHELEASILANASDYTVNGMNSTFEVQINKCMLENGPLDPANLSKGLNDDHPIFYSDSNESSGYQQFRGETVPGKNHACQIINELSRNPCPPDSFGAEISRPMSIISRDSREIVTSLHDDDTFTSVKNYGTLFLASKRKYNRYKDCIKINPTNSDNFEVDNYDKLRCIQDSLLSCGSTSEEELKRNGMISGPLDLHDSICPTQTELSETLSNSDYLFSHDNTKRRDYTTENSNVSSNEVCATHYERDTISVGRFCASQQGEVGEALSEVDSPFELSESDIDSFDSNESDISSQPGDVSTDCDESDMTSQSGSVLADDVVSDVDIEVGNFEEARIDGRRITNISYMFTELHTKFDNHGRDYERDCDGNFRDLRCYKTFDQGMRTKMFFTCVKCNHKDSVWTDPPAPTDMLPLHEAFVCGNLTSGSGYSGGQEQLAAMSICCISARTYRKVRETLAPTIKTLCENQIKAAGERERQLAIEANNITAGGIPYTTVIGDGVWSKRSYQDGRYDALSGVAVLVSAITGLILFMGIRNKYCLVDARADNLGVEPPKHTCYKNWGRDAASTAMEADIIASGFRQSEKMHGLIYKTFVGDGDSSTHTTILRDNAYCEHGIVVNKLGCPNHAFRCATRRLKVISRAPAKASLPRGKIGKVRKRVHGSGRYMRSYIEVRIAEISKEQISEREKEAKLFKAIANMTGHFFGDHSRCDSSFSDCAKIKENIVPDLKKIDMYEQIEKVVDSLAADVKSLLAGQTTNPAEWFNSILNKLTGGRRINHSLRESYSLRAYLAVLQFNHQNALSELSQSRGMPAPTAVIKMEAARQAQNLRTAESRKSHGRKRRHKRGTDRNYGDKCEVPDLPEDIYEKLVENHFDRLRERQQRRHEIESETVHQSMSPEWQQYRKTMITASICGPICRMKKETSCAVTVSRICHPTPLNCAEIRYGKENESTAIRLLANRLAIEIRPCGLFIDEKIPYLGATPDGLIGNDGIVEVKCLAVAGDLTPQAAVEEISHYRRIFDKNDRALMNKTHHYYYQVQAQLHVTQREYCIFALWTPLDIMYVTVNRDDNFWKNDMEPILIRFYQNCVLPEIIDSRKQRRLPIRDPEYIKQAKEEKRKRNEELKKNKAQTSQKKGKNTKRAPPPKKHCGTSKQDASDNEDSDVSRDFPVFDASCEDIPSDMPAAMNITTKPKNNAWVEIIDEDPDREPDEAELIAIQVVMENIDQGDVIREIRSAKVLLSSASVDTFLQIVEETSDFHVYFSHYFPYPHLVTPSTTTRDLHIIGGNSFRHWFCMFYDGSNIFAYDSGGRMEYELLRPDEKKYITKRYPALSSNDVIFQPTTIQRDSTSCGVYAAAFATTIALSGGDPMRVSHIDYSLDVLEMRNHMITIIEQKQLLPFPTIPGV